MATTPRVFLLPKDTSSSNLTVISLPHPRTLAPTRFLVHPKTGLYELTKIAPSATTPRSWLFTTPSKATSSKDEKKEEEAKEEERETDEKEVKGNEEKSKATTPKTADWLGNGQTMQDASLYVTTPIDPIFILLPRLLPAADAPKAHFLPLDDILDTFTATDDDDDAKDVMEKSHWETALKPGSQSRRQIETRIKVVCDTVDVGGEMAYRLSQEKMLALLVRKCENMAKGGLPKSMEDAFVVKPLARPISEVQEETEKEGEADGKKDEAQEKNTAGEESVLPTPLDSQATLLSDSQPTPQPDSQPAPHPNSQPAFPPASPAVYHLLRIRVASQFLLTSYLPTRLSASFNTALSSAYDFTPLDTYLSELKRLRFEAVALRSGDFSLKRGYNGDDGEAEAKRRKREEEEEAEKKRKKNVSRGVRDLGKVNTRGMAKMTSFFKKKQ